MWMKRMIVTGVLLCAIASVAWAERIEYQVMLNKDKGLCAAILGLINTGMNRNGEMRYVQHDIFVH